MSWTGGCRLRIGGLECARTKAREMRARRVVSALSRLVRVAPGRPVVVGPSGFLVRRREDGGGRGGEGGEGEGEVDHAACSRSVGAGGLAAIVSRAHRCLCGSSPRSVMFHRISTSPPPLSPHFPCGTRSGRGSRFVSPPLSLWTAMITALVGALLAFHAYLLGKGQTTNEYLRGEKRRGGIPHRSFFPNCGQLWCGRQPSR